MARYLKNTQLKGGSYAIQLPMGTDSLGPDAPVDGQIRYNQSNSKVELWYNNTWNMVAKIGTVTIEKDTFTTVDAQTSYGDMKYTYSAGQEENVVVFVGGVHQVPGTNYQFDGSKKININPSTGGTANQTIIVIHNLNSTKTIGD